MNAPTSLSSQVQVGQRIPGFAVPTLSHGEVQVPGPGFTHLQFHRFAGCPVCNLHVRRFATEHAALEAAGIRTVAFFHSSADAMRPFQGDLPFPVVPDLERRWYAQFGVERSTLALLHPGMMWAAARGMFSSAPSNPLVGEGGMDGLPADLLLDATGVVRAAHYGRYAGDSWSVQTLLGLVASLR